jgi:hypothetical protein
MSRADACPDPKKILAELKDFQRVTVDYVFRRLYLDKDPTNRFLIADEVGLGKTLVARGLIAKAIEHLWDKVGRIDIVYICSNADIARQNINRLNVTGDDDFSLASRITLLPLHISDLGERRMNFVSFTPGTSFEQKAGLGIQQERALIYWLLDRAWGISGKAAARNVLRGRAQAAGFEWLVQTFDRSSIDESIASAFGTALLKRKELRSRFDQLCACFSRSDSRVSEEEWRDRRNFVAEIRAMLASVCLHALQPDLIILDEFQRFKHLLSGEDEASRLAQELFSYSSEHSQVRVILLSATPYKMLSLHHEVDEDHYEDFRRTLSFLEGTNSETSRFKPLLENYRSALFQIKTAAGLENLKTAKSKLETDLKKVMVRTERLAMQKDRAGMLSDRAGQNLRLTAEDVTGYVALQNAADLLIQGNIIEYWKSAPYVFNFMDEYQLKNAFVRSRGNSERASGISKIIRRFPELLLPWKRAANYRSINDANPRLRALMADTVGIGAWRLLWIPPALPYYQLKGVFADPALARFTKRLVFSSWRVVPKVIACLVTYEAERRAIRSFEQHARNTPDARKRRRPLLRFAFTDNRLTGMPILCLVYPSSTLARECDPRDLPRTGNGVADLPNVDEMLSAFRARIDKLLNQLPVKRFEAAREDENWYWAAPILLDLAAQPKATWEWWARRDLAAIWAGSEEDDPAAAEENRWTEHVAEARRLIERFRKGEACLGPAPADLSLVLAQVAAAGPATAVLRAMSRLTGGRVGKARDAAAAVGRSFLSLFNLPEATALIRGIKDEEPFWRRVLEYSIDGGLQAVLDEYAHILHESLGLVSDNAENISAEIAKAMTSALTLRTSSLRVDSIEVSARTFEPRDEAMRGRFAMRFGEEQSEGGAQVTRADRVRTAFNSPFWPFVLATTSVGQEGLDFHPYCHAVVHWNLPSNPVDLEQREGRVHRYKGHAVRKNLSGKFGREALRTNAVDAWEKIFEMGKQTRAAGETDLVPYWLFPGQAQIERHVPALPLSRDIERLEYLRRALTVYRMVFGQNRQEDLISYLLANVPEPQVAELLKDVIVNLSPPDALVA